jgi:hypothetical protein
MRTLRLLLLATAFVAAVHAAEEAGILLKPGSVDTGWAVLLGALAAKAPLRAPFTERRFFPFRREATVLTGVLRVSPERGLSLQYLEPEPSVLIADNSGLVLRDQNGRSREMPEGSREAGAIASLLPIMRFDLPALFPRFEIRAQRTGPDWKFEFTPRDPEAASSLGAITVAGSGQDVRHLQFRRSASQRIEIDVGQGQSGLVFTADELRKFYR